MSAPASPVTVLAGRVRLSVRLTPKASASRILGLAEEADGGRVLKIAVSAPPEGGKANAALIELLARALKVPRGAVSIVVGAASRKKLVDIEGDPAELSRRVLSLVEPGSGRG